jgi:hypothetical protein
LPDGLSDLPSPLRQRELGKRAFIRESAGKPSKAAVLIVALRFTGQSQGRFTLSRLATYRS